MSPLSCLIRTALPLLSVVKVCRWESAWNIKSVTTKHSVVCHLLERSHIAPPALILYGTCPVKLSPPSDPLEIVRRGKIPVFLGGDNFTGRVGMEIL